MRSGEVWLSDDTGYRRKADPEHIFWGIGSYNPYQFTSDEPPSSLKLSSSELRSPSSPLRGRRWTSRWRELLLPGNSQKGRQNHGMQAAGRLQWPRLVGKAPPPGAILSAKTCRVTPGSLDAPTGGKAFLLGPGNQVKPPSYPDHEMLPSEGFCLQ